MATKGPGQQSQERHDTTAAPDGAAVERDIRDLRQSLGRERFVSRAGRAQWARGVDEAPAVTHRQVFRSIGGALGKAKRAVISFAQDGVVRARARAALSTYSDDDLSAEDRRALRRMLDHYRVTDDVEGVG